MPRESTKLKQPTQGPTVFINSTGECHECLQENV